MAETTPVTASPPVATPPAEVALPQEPPARRMSALIRFPVAAILGALIAVFASYLLRKIGF